jgi:hypothetical protein
LRADRKSVTGDSILEIRYNKKGEKPSKKPLQLPDFVLLTMRSGRKNSSSIDGPGVRTNLLYNRRWEGRRMVDQ